MLNLDICRELQSKEFGITSASWVICEQMNHKNIYFTVEDNPFYEGHVLEIIPCPTFEEIWDKLPMVLTPKDAEMEKLELSKTCIAYWPENEDKERNIVSRFNISTEINGVTEATAKLWLLLKKENLI